MPGDQEVVLIVTYPDGTVDEVPVKIHVKSDAENNSPTAQSITVDQGVEPNPQDGISNIDDLPGGTNYAFKTPVDTTKPGDQTVVVVITYPDGSTKEIDVPLHVNYDNEVNDLVGQVIAVDKGTTPTQSMALPIKTTCRVVPATHLRHLSIPEHRVTNQQRS